MNWIISHWQYIAIGAIVLINIFNVASKHWSEHKGVVKLLTFLTEVLSIVTSYGVVNGRLGKLKAPLQSVKPGGGK